MIEWGENQWQVAIPEGRFSTFNLRAVDPKSTRAGYSFVSSRVFAGVTVFNSSCVDVKLQIHSPQNMDFSVTIPAGQLRRVKTGWNRGTPRINFETLDGATLGALAFDDFEYTEDATLPPGVLEASRP